MSKILSEVNGKKLKVTFTKTNIELFKFPCKICQRNTLAIIVKNLSKKGFVITLI